MKNGHFIGIDFGTTNTAVVKIINGDFGQKIDVLNDERYGKVPFPSIVAIPKDGSDDIKFGREVRDNRISMSENYDIYTSMKSFLGTDKTFKVGDKRYSATDITALFLSYIKSQIMKSYNYIVTSASYSFPIDFPPNARKELKSASIKAGITPLGFIGESTAAYISTRKTSQGYSNVMVLDWGGGTFDISILDVKGSKVSEKSVWGEKIGGDDIDLEFAYRLHSKIVQESKNENKTSFEEMTPQQKDTILSACEQAKIEFSTYDEDYRMTLRNYGDYGTTTKTITYEFFDSVAQNIIKTKIYPAINKALERAEMSINSIDAVVLVGGSTNIPSFITAISNLFGEEKIIVPDKAQWSVATGTGLMQLVGNNFVLNDTVGLLMSDNSVYPILKKDDDYVGSEVKNISFALTEDAQNANFIFTNSDNSYTYARTSIPTKGYNKEMLNLSAKIDDDQIAKITITNDSMGDNCKKEMAINKLKFYYDLSELE